MLNKLTPEKFDILSKQLLQLVTNSETLHGTINLIFENAVAQPTFVVVYADLCNSLAQVRRLFHLPIETKKNGALLFLCFPGNKLCVSFFPKQRTRYMQRYEETTFLDLRAF